MVKGLRQATNEYPPPSPPTTRPGVYIGWVGVGWRRRCRTGLSLREIDSRGTIISLFVCSRLPPLAVEFDHFVRGEH